MDSIASKASRSVLVRHAVRLASVRDLLSGSTKPPADVQLPVFISSTAVEQTKLVLLQVKGKLQMYILYLLAAEDNLDHQTIAALEKFLVSCLSKDPDERLAPIRELLEQLAPEK
jgi:hypothetical protein